MRNCLFKLYFLAIFLSSSAHAQPLSAEAVDTIANMSQLICGSYQIEGSKQGVSADGDVNIELDKMLKSLVGVGINGSAKFSAEKYIGLVRDQLGQDRLDVRKCRLFIYKDLSSKISSINEHPSNGDADVRGESATSDARNVTESELKINVMLDANDNNAKNYSFDFKITKLCNVFVNFPGKNNGLGAAWQFDMRTKVGSVLLQSYGGKNPAERSVELPPGIYIINLIAKRDAGFRRISLHSVCN